MWRFVAGAGAAICLMGAGYLWGQSGHPQPDQPMGLASLSPNSPAFAADEPVSTPEATPKSREEKRFNRYDKDKNGAITRAEYLLSRQKAFAKQDVNGDGRLSLDEYAVKTIAKFTAADKDRTGSLTATEFATTAVKRKPSSKADCAPTRSAPLAKDSGPDSDNEG